MNKHSKNRDRSRTHHTSQNEVIDEPDQNEDDSTSAQSSGVRQQRIEHRLQQELEWLFRDEINDPKLQHVRVARVEVSVDFRAARVHFILIEGEAYTRSHDEALERVTPYVRASLSDSLGVKRVPLVRFVFQSGEG